MNDGARVRSFAWTVGVLGVALASLARATVLVPASPVGATADVNSGDAAKTIDGNIGSYWQAAAANPAITFDLGGAVPIGGFRESSDGFPGNAFSLEVSTDGTTYTAIFTGTLTNGGFGEHTFSVQPVRFLRMFVQSDPVGGFGELAEFQVLVVCGDGVALLGEQCDDGNTEGGDCCSATCQAEVGNACTTDGNPCTDDVCGVAGTCTHPANAAPCDDGLFCNGADQCASGGCNAHAGDPCVGGAECANQCDEAHQTCDLPAGSPCSDDGSVCTTDLCDGAGNCVHPPANPGLECRAAAGPCDVAETCTGTSSACPADGKSTAVCRPAVGACDVAESCDGVGNDCPADQVVAAGTVCRPAAGVCDVGESCDGVAADCPADAFLPATTVCRASTGVCDLAETCTGSGASCPADTGQPDTDGDGQCDLLDDCPNAPDPGQADTDGDGVGDACDPCTNTVPVFGVAGKTKLTLTKIPAPGGDDKVKFSGRFTNLPLTPAVDPLTKGMRVLINDATGGTVLDATIPGGLYDPIQKIGWKKNASGTSFKYINKTPSAVNGMQKASLKVTPTLQKFTLGGKNGSYPVNTAHLPVHTTLVVDSPIATTGQCGEMFFPGPKPAPACSLSSSGVTLRCK